jgi:hypothetical protein
LQHRLLVLLGPHDRLCGERLCRSHDLLRTAASLLHRFGLVLLGSRSDLLRTASKLLRSVGLISAGRLKRNCPIRPGSRSIAKWNERPGHFCKRRRNRRDSSFFVLILQRTLTSLKRPRQGSHLLAGG